MRRRRQVTKQRATGLLAVLALVVSIAGAAGAEEPPPPLVPTSLVDFPSNSINDVAITPDGAIVLAEKMAGYPVVIKYDAQGTEVWRRIIGSFGKSGWAIDVGPTGTIFVSTSSTTISAYDRSGTFLWGAASTVLDQIRDLSATVDGGVFLTGDGPADEGFLPTSIRPAPSRGHSHL